MSDRADEIARDVVWNHENSERLQGAIAAALRSYGDEQVQEFRQRTMHGDRPALKTSPSTQETT